MANVKFQLPATRKQNKRLQPSLGKIQQRRQRNDNMDKQEWQVAGIQEDQYQ